MKFLRAAVAVCALLLLSASSLWAQGMYVPPGIQPGQQYRLIFSSTDQINSTSSDIATYNAFVTAQANQSGSLVENLSTTWTAVASTASVNARDNTSTVPGTDSAANGGAGIPVYNLRVDAQGNPQSDLIATNYSDLWNGNLLNSIQFDQFGSVQSGQGNDVWTGTNSDGIGFAGRTLGTAEPIFGKRNQTNATWIVTTNPQRANTDLMNIYAISGVFNAPAAIPEPGSLALAMTLAGCCGFAARKRRRKDSSPATPPEDDQSLSI